MSIETRKRLPVNEHFSLADWDTLIDHAKSNPDWFRKLIKGITEGPPREIEMKTDNRPMSVDEMFVAFGLVADDWEVIELKVNQWGVGAKLKDENGNWYMTTTPLFQTKMSLRPTTESIHRRFWSDFESVSKQVAGRIESTWEVPEVIVRSIAVQFCMFDFHLGKSGMDDKWTIERCTDIWCESINTMLASITNMAGVSLDAAILPIGNDFLHIDNSKGTTYNGTNVGPGDSYYRTGLAGIELINWAVERLVKFGFKKVYVVSVPGNHDWDSTFWLMQQVKAYFKDTEQVEFRDHQNHRNTMMVGLNLFEWRHGNYSNAKEVAAKLPVREPDMWAKSKYRAIYMGHLHTQKKTTFAEFDHSEHNGVDCWVVPSLAPTDQWHDANEFVGNRRRAAAFVYDMCGGLLSVSFADLDVIERER